MPLGILMGNINCPKCNKLIIDPKVVKLDNSGKPIIFCDCGCYFVFELKK